MEQKYYNLEIVEKLLRKKSHARELAKLVGTNHTTIIRKISELKDLNVVDFSMEGKNKVYFMKRGLEARAFVFMVEYYRLLKFIEKYSILRRIVEGIQKNDSIDLAIIFGSYAKDLAKKDSDVDIFVESVEKRVKEEVEKLDSKVSVKIGKFDVNNLLVREIMDNYIIIKGVEVFYDRTKFFEKTI